MRSEPLVAGVELGGTKCVCVLASGPDDVRAEVRLPTTTPAETMVAARAVLDGWRKGPGFAALGLASFGPLDLERSSATFGSVVATPKSGWSGADLLTLAVDAGVPVGIDTDVNGAALAEGLWGATRGLRSFAYITMGTGIGVGSIVDGRAIRGLGHSEAGHIRIPRAAGDDWPGVCPYHGDCVEGLASGPAIEARAGRPGDRLTADDPAWDGVVHAMAMLLHNLVLTTAPSRILIGGGIGCGQPHLLPRLRSALIESLAGYSMVTAVAADIATYLAPPALGSRAGPLGAIAVALAELEAANSVARPSAPATEHARRRGQ